MIELHKLCLIVGKLVPSYSDKRVFWIYNSVQLAFMEPNPDKVIYYASQSRFLFDMFNDKVYVKLLDKQFHNKYLNYVDFY